MKSESIPFDTFSIRELASMRRMSDGMHVLGRPRSWTCMRSAITERLVRTSLRPRIRVHAYTPSATAALPREQLPVRHEDRPLSLHS